MKRLLWSAAAVLAVSWLGVAHAGSRAKAPEPPVIMDSSGYDLTCPGGYACWEIEADKNITDRPPVP